MKNTFKIFLAAVLLALHAISFAQTEGLVRKNDSLFWQAYNRCDVSGMHEFIADDVEFYHDKGGTQHGWTEFEATTRRNLCRDFKAWHLRREAAAGSVKFFPMEKDGVVYGAILTGEHYFYVIEDGKPEVLTGKAKFTHLWLLSGGKWKMARILSYDHGPAR